MSGHPPSFVGDYFIIVGCCCMMGDFKVQLLSLMHREEVRVNNKVSAGCRQTFRLMWCKKGEKEDVSCEALSAHSAVGSAVG